MVGTGISAKTKCPPSHHPSTTHTHTTTHKTNTLTQTQASLQNLLDLALSSLRAIPEYGQREVVLLYGGLTTCDPGDVFETIKKLARHRVRVRVFVLWW